MTLKIIKMNLENKTGNQFSLLIKMSIAVIIFWALSAILIYSFISNWGDRGAVGDLCGAVNALFSGLAFAALIFTIILQRDEIKQNRSEILLNRKELAKGSKLQQKAQTVLMQQVAQTHLSAQMNAMRILVDYYNNQISNPKSTTEIIDKAKLKRKAIIIQIDKLIDGLDNSEVE